MVRLRDAIWRRALGTLIGGVLRRYPNGPNCQARRRQVAAEAHPGIPECRGDGEWTGQRILSPGAPRAVMEWRDSRSPDGTQAARRRPQAPPISSARDQGAGGRRVQPSALRPQPVRRTAGRSDVAIRAPDLPQKTTGPHDKPAMRGARMEETAFAEGRGPDPATKDKTIGNSGVAENPLEIPANDDPLTAMRDKVASRVEVGKGAHSVRCARVAGPGPQPARHLPH
jgi:hypothetical protein